MGTPVDVSAFALLGGEIGVFAAAALFAWIVLAWVTCPRSWEKDPGATGPQHIHLAPTSRLGGQAIFLGFVLAVAIALELELMPAQPALSLMLAVAPMQIVGLWEDIAHRVPPRYRLLATVFSAALASAFAQGVIKRLDLPFLDGWITYLFLHGWVTYLAFTLPLTWFMVAGACNALNIIDGNNGLAGGSALLMFVGLAIVAGNAGDMLVLSQAVAMTGTLVAFLLWNYPNGKVFLGDAGAYFIGFMYAQLSIQLIGRNAGVSAWFVIALAAYPIVETLFSIYRRKILHRAAAMQPDVLHLHSLLYVSFLRVAERPPPEERRLGLAADPYPDRERRQPERRANARVAPRLWLHGALCFVAALAFYNNTPALIGFTLIYGIYYIVCYRKAARLSGDMFSGHMTRQATPATGALLSAIPGKSIAATASATPPTNY